MSRPLPAPPPPPCPKGPYEAMVLSCIDPRIIDQVHHYMNAVQKLTCKYSQFVIAGAAVGVIAPAFRTWHETFWENLASSVALHNIKRVIAIDHRDCGAAKIAYGAGSIADPEIETKTHSRVLAEFRRRMSYYQPQLEVETILMDLDGKVKVFK